MRTTREGRVSVGWKAEAPWVVFSAGNWKDSKWLEFHKGMSVCRTVAGIENWEEGSDGAM